MIAFDKCAPGGGVNADCSMENGKVILKWQIMLTQIDFRGFIRLRMWDAQGNMVLECLQSSDEEEPLVSVLLQPHLWQGAENPYRYRLEAVLEDRQGNFIDRIDQLFPLRCMELRRMPGENREQLFLNGEKLNLRAVSYVSVEGEGNGMERMLHSKEALREQQEVEDRQIMQDLERILALGANCICFRDQSQLSDEIRNFCDRNGLLTIVHLPGNLVVGEKSFSVDKDKSLDDYLGKIPAFPGLDMVLYRARWSKVPFVHICADSIKHMASGNYMVTCYSNCPRLALYSDGKFFEFQKGEEVFAFQEIPVKGPCIMLSVEGQGCSASLSLHKTFTKSDLALPAYHA